MMQRSWLSWIKGETSFRGIDGPLLDEAMHGLTIAEAVILQAAFAGLVADRAIKRVIEQQILHDHPLVLLDLRAVGHEHRQILRLSLAGRYKLGNHLDLAGLGILRAGFDLAHAAICNHRERRVRAVIGNLDPDFLRHLNGVQLLAVGNRILIAINDDSCHMCA